MAEAGAVAHRSPRRRGRGPGLIDLYLVRGAAAPFLLILLAVLVAMMLERALRLIHQLAAGGADISYLPALLLQLVPYYLDLALPAAFALALAVLVARLDDRLELEALLASGRSLARVAAPLVGFGLVIAAASLVNSGWLDPHGRYNFRALRIEAVNAGRIGSLQPGAIHQPGDSLAVTFDSRAPDGSLRGIFLWQRRADGRELAFAGERGRIGFVREGRLLGADLGAGRYLIDRPGQGRPALVAFDALAFREPLRLADSSWRRGWDQKELTLAELVRARRHPAESISHRAIDAEYFSRIARAATLPLMPLLVLPLAFATKKGRRGMTLLLCAGLVAAVHHSLNLAKGLALRGAADPLLSILGVTALAALAVALVFWAGRHLPSHGPIHDRLRPLGEAFARPGLREGSAAVVVRRTIGAYLLAQLAKWTAAALLATVLLLQMVDLFDQGENFVERGMGLADVGYYAWLRLGPMVQQALPIAALAGAMITFAAFGRSREMTAIRAAGISQWRILAMTLPVPLALALACAALAEFATPASELRLANWWTATAPRRTAEATPRWFRIGDEIVRADRASRGGQTLHRIEIFRRDGGRLTERLRAAAASYDRGRWSLSQVETVRLDSDRIALRRDSRSDWPVQLRPEDVDAFFAAPQSLSAASAQRSLADLAPSSVGAAPYATRLFRSVAEPLAPIVMLLLALPIAFVAPRTGAAWPAFLYAGAGGLAYLVADGVLTVTARVGVLPPMVGAWTAPVIVALGALTILLYNER